MNTPMQRPNVLLFYVDDLFSLEAHRKVFGFEIKTPNIDSIAKRGTRFDSAYCAVPVCGPSRAATLTGLSPHQIGLLDNDADWKDYLRPEHAVQYRIRRAGYRTVTQGKVFHGYKAQPAQVYEALYDNTSFEDRLTYYPKGDDFTNFGGFKGGRGYHSGEEQFYDSQVAEMAIESLKAETGEQPFHMEVGFRNPHTARHNPARFFEDIPLEDITVPKAWKKGWHDPDFPEFFQSKDPSWRNPGSWSASQLDLWRRTVRAYFASIHFLDYSVGRVLNALEASPFADNTMIVFVTDHGMHLGDRGQTGKFSCYEGSARTPLIVAVPGQKPRVVKIPVSLADLAPTLLDYCGAPPAEHHVGQSLRPLIEGRQAKRPARGIPTFWYGTITMRVQDRRMTLWQDGTVEHHNVVKDYWQQSQLKDDPHFESDYALLVETCASWGMSISRDGGPFSCAAPTQSRFSPGDTSALTAAGRVSAIGQIDDTLRPPGDHMLWTTSLLNDQTVRIPAHVRSLKSATRQSGGPQTMRIVGSDADSDIDLTMMTWPSVEVVLGSGRDVVTLNRTPSTVFCGHGQNIIHANGEDHTIYAGPGDTTIQLMAGKNTVVCRGGGKNTIFLGRGADTIVTHGGTNQIFGGKGRAQLVIQGGKSVIEPRGKAFDIAFHRTGRPQIIRGLRTSDSIDISEWSALSKVGFVTSGKRVIVTCGREQLTIENTSLTVVKQRISY